VAERILVVEDDEKSRRLLKDVLGFHGFDVHAVETGEEGVELAQRIHPDAILLDVQLPGINGFEVLERLRGSGHLTDVPVLAVTASAMEHDRHKILAAGFDAYLPKPVDFSALLVTLRRMLARAST
jgi:two-component system cell cycle response regulator DivK